MNNNALRAALLDTNPATAFNPFGLNQNSPAVIDKVFITAIAPARPADTRRPEVIRRLFWNASAGPLSFAIGGEHRTEYEKISLTR